MSAAYSYKQPGRLSSIILNFVIIRYYIEKK